MTNLPSVSIYSSYSPIGVNVCTEIFPNLNFCFCFALFHPPDLTHQDLKAVCGASSRMNELYSRGWLCKLFMHVVPLGSTRSARFAPRTCGLVSLPYFVNRGYHSMFQQIPLLKLLHVMQGELSRRMFRFNAQATLSLNAAETIYHWLIS